MPFQVVFPFKTFSTICAIERFIHMVTGHMAPQVTFHSICLMANITCKPHFYWYGLTSQFHI